MEEQTPQPQPQQEQQQLPQEPTQQSQQEQDSQEHHEPHHVEHPFRHDEGVRRRIAKYKEALEPMEGTTKLDMKLIRQLAFDGIPDQAGLRSVYWKILLGYLPRDKSLWEETVQKQRKSYYELKSYFKFDPNATDVVEAGDHVNKQIKANKTALYCLYVF